MNKILVVLTGGTIGSKINNNTIDVHPESAYNLIQYYQKQYGKEVEFEVMQPFNILSENLKPVHWEVLQKAIKGVDYKKYIGIIVTHGSDTIPYTAAFLGICFRLIPIPIVIIASDYALEDKRSNGISNFRGAICLIQDNSLNGIFTVYENKQKEKVIYLATRMMESDPYEDQFRSFGNEPFGWIEKEKVILNQVPQNPSKQELNQKKAFVIGNWNGCHENIVFENQVLAIRPYPGIHYSVYQNIDFEDIKAVIHYAYHSATACSEGSELLEFIKNCVGKGIDFYMASFKRLEGDLYKSSKQFLEVGAIPLCNISWEAATVKTTIAYNQNQVNPKLFMKNNIYYEELPRRIQ